MGAFEYSALDAKGKVKKGVLEGDSAKAIRQQLRERGWTPLELEEVGEREARRGGGGGFSLQRGVSATDLALITRQLATLVRSALPLEESLRAVAEQTEKARLKSMMLAVRSRVMEGHSLAQGLREFPHVFNELFCTTVAAGEQSGHLDIVLERLADYTESRQVLRQKVSLALIYPILLSLVAVGVVVGLLAYVVPQVVQVFEHIGQKLPALTRGLISLSEFLQAHGLVLFLGIVVTAVLIGTILKRSGPKRAWHRTQLGLPLIGKLVRGVNAARFARTFSILTASSVPVLEALRISAEVITNVPMREVVTEGTARVREGASISESLRKSGYFPPMTIHLMASGESSGKLEEMLERAADNQEREVQSLVATMLGLFEPIMILGMGGLVLVIVLAILMPIFEMNQLVQ
ncbi:MAG: type II secretion system inner membrane protein GspF [Chromatiales bacterium]|nr:type II secretion system inner membrane protein GspF [Chromatiales bacterium]